MIPTLPTLYCSQKTCLFDNVLCICRLQLHYLSQTKTEMEFFCCHEKKPHLCDFCGKAFTTIDALGKHKEAEHTSEYLFHLFVCSSAEEGSNENLKMQISSHMALETMQIEPPSTPVKADELLSATVNTNEPPSATIKTNEQPTATVKTDELPSATTKTDRPPSATTTTDRAPSAKTKTNEPPSATAKTNEPPTATTQTDEPSSATVKTDGPPSTTTMTDEPPRVIVKTEEQPSATMKTDEPSSATVKSDEPPSATTKCKVIRVNYAYNHIDVRPTYNK